MADAVSLKCSHHASPTRSSWVRSWTERGATLEILDLPAINRVELGHSLSIAPKCQKPAQGAIQRNRTPEDRASHQLTGLQVIPILTTGLEFFQASPSMISRRGNLPHFHKYMKFIIFIEESFQDMGGQKEFAFAHSKFYRST
jgi:hypothetical protein